jgi:hypothetical protein
MKKVFILFITFSLSTLVYGEDINLLCKIDSTKENEKFSTYFPISLIEKNNGSYSIFFNEKNVETLDKDVDKVQVKNVLVTKNQIEFEIHTNIIQYISPDGKFKSNSGYENRYIKISRIDGHFLQTIFWKGGWWEGMGNENPITLTGHCKKRTQNKF